MTDSLQKMLQRRAIALFVEQLAPFAHSETVPWVTPICLAFAAAAPRSTRFG